MANYVISDLHGHFALYNAFLKKINFVRTDTLYILGDVIDRGDDGVKIIKDIMKRKNVVFLPGNHEDILVKVVRSLFNDSKDKARLCEIWWHNGGEGTARELFKLENDEIIKIEKYIRNRPLSVTVKVGERTFLLAHASPLAMTQAQYEANCAKQAEETNTNIDSFTTYRQWLLWKRVEEEDEFPEDIIAVFGHTPTAYYQDNLPYEIWQYENKIGIDCGLASFHNGNKNSRLGCLCLDDLSMSYTTRKDIV